MTAGSTGSHESYRQFYWGFTWKHEPVVWGFMEENYLRRYRGCLRVDFDWMADRLWEIPFPGSVYMGISVELEGFGISGSLAARGRAWQASQDRLDVAEKDPDPGAIDAEGLDISKEVKLFLGNDYYVEYRPFREISIKGGEAVELEAPAFITDLAR
jgi:hypothetical protein